MRGFYLKSYTITITGFVEVNSKSFWTAHLAVCVWRVGPIWPVVTCALPLASAWKTNQSILHIPVNVCVISKLTFQALNNAYHEWFNLSKGPVLGSLFRLGVGWEHRFSDSLSQPKRALYSVPANSSRYVLWGPPDGSSNLQSNGTSGKI